MTTAQVLAMRKEVLLQAADVVEVPQRFSHGYYGCLGCRVADLSKEGQREAGEAAQDDHGHIPPQAH